MTLKRLVMVYKVSVDGSSMVQHSGSHHRSVRYCSCSLLQQQVTLMTIGEATALHILAAGVGFDDESALISDAMGAY